MDALAKLKEELARKRKQAEELSIDVCFCCSNLLNLIHAHLLQVGGKKMIRRADILAKEEKEYMEKQALKKQKQKVFSLLFYVSHWNARKKTMLLKRVAVRDRRSMSLMMNLSPELRYFFFTIFATLRCRFVTTDLLALLYHASLFVLIINLKVIRRLRSRGQPIIIFGESEADARMRLIQ